MPLPNPSGFQAIDANLKARVSLLGLLNLIEARLLRDVLALSSFGGSSRTSTLRGVFSL